MIKNKHSEPVLLIERLDACGVEGDAGIFFQLLIFKATLTPLLQMVNGVCSTFLRNFESNQKGIRTSINE